MENNNKMTAFEKYYESSSKTPKRKLPSINGKRRNIFFIALAILFEALIFAIPVCFSVDAAGKVGHFKFIYNVFSEDGFELLGPIVFAAHLIPFLLTVAFAILHFRYLFQNNDNFNKNTGLVVGSCAVVAFLFLLVGIYVVLFYQEPKADTTYYTLTFLPITALAMLMLMDSVLNGRYREVQEKVTRKTSEIRILMVVFVLLFALVAILAIFSKILIANYTGDYTQRIKVSGYDVLAHYKSYGESFQVLAFVLLSVIILVALSAILTLLSFFRNSRLFKSFFICSVSLDFFCVAGLAGLGLSYQYIEKANMERLAELFEYYGVTLNEQWAFYSDTIYYFIAAAVLMVALFLFKPYSRLVAEEIRAARNKRAESAPLPSAEMPAEAPAYSAPTAPEPMRKAAAAPHSEPIGTAETPLRVETQALKQPLAIDQCPPFTFLDSQTAAFNADRAQRRQAAFPEPSLPALVHFVKEYAKNSRLHLSYTAEDIATFVAGLGISRLSILQGMSGTGKTSLPKIFSEAVFGNCEIIEVESSWKDKNELLGYYNEFSKTYIPKSFTQDLYKAKLNPDILTFIVLDEMNLSRIEYYFSDFLSLMENEEDKREIKLVNVKIANYESGARVPYKMLKNDMTLQIPKNVWFIGTANRDESTFEISDKVYDRANTMNFNRRAKKIVDFDEPMQPRFLSANVLSALFKDATQKKHFDLSDCKQIQKAEEILLPYNLSFGNRIERQIEDFVKIYSACFEGQDVTREAVEKIYLSKVVAKLEWKTVENKEELAAQFEEIGLKKCAEFVRKLNEDI